MTGLQTLLRRWQISHWEQQHRRFAQAGDRSTVMLGAYGLGDLDPSRSHSAHR